LIVQLPEAAARYILSPAARARAPGAHRAQVAVGQLRLVRELDADQPVPAIPLEVGRLLVDRLGDQIPGGVVGVADVARGQELVGGVVGVGGLRLREVVGLGEAIAEGIVGVAEVVDRLLLGIGLRLADEAIERVILVRDRLIAIFDDLGDRASVIVRVGERQQGIVIRLVVPQRRDIAVLIERDAGVRAIGPRDAGQSADAVVVEGGDEIARLGQGEELIEVVVAEGGEAAQPVGSVRPPVRRAVSRAETRAGHAGELVSP
jgi:hypothetical protein